MTSGILPRLPNSIVLVNAGGTPTPEMMRWWQEVSEKLEFTIADLQEATVDIQTALSTAQTAKTTADAATSAVNQIRSDYALTTSYVTGLSLTATDAGANATVNISPHLRLYSGEGAVSVSGGSVTGLIYNFDYWIYYDQPSRSGGAVVYQATTAYVDAFKSLSNPDRHFVGAITAPVAGAPDTIGDPVIPCGYTAP